MRNTVFVLLFCISAVLALKADDTNATQQVLVPRVQNLLSLTTSGVSWTLIGPYEEGSGKCRTATGTDGVPDTDFTVSSDVSSVADCKTACANSSPCVAVGFTGGVCQLWKNLPSTSSSEASSYCLRKAVTATGTSLCGDNHFSQLGLGQSKSVGSLHNTPVTFTQSAFGNYHSLFLDAGTNKLYSAGNNVFGQLGLGDFTQRSVPTEVPLGAHTISMIAAGGAHSIVVTTSGNVLTFGRNSHGQLCNSEKGGVLSVPQLLAVTNIKSASAGFAHTILITTGDTLMACGNNKDGQLGMGNLDEYLVPTNVPSITHVKSVACGAKHTLVLTELQGGAGTPCGMGDRETLDHSSHTYTQVAPSSYYPCVDPYVDASCGNYGAQRGQYNPVTIDMGTANNIGGVIVQGVDYPRMCWPATVDVAVKETATGSFTPVGSQFTTGLTGWNDKFYVEFPSIKTAHAVQVTPRSMGGTDARRCHQALRVSPWTCASTFEVKAFGSNTHGQLGMTTDTYTTPTNVPLEGFDGSPASIAAGQSHSIVTLSSGKVVVFGFNYYGQLGLPSRGSVASDIKDETSPTYMELPSGKLAAKVVAGSHHTVVKMTDSTVWGVGRNYDGQLATGQATPDERSLTQIPVSFGVSDIVAGGGVTAMVA